MRGKDKCKILREIRKKIAEENDIQLITKDCTYQGECRGTCPKCESEVRYLEAQLAQRQRLGKSAVVAALMAGIAMGATGCAPGGEPESGLQTSTETEQSGGASRIFSFFRGDTEGDVPNPDAEPDDMTGAVEYTGSDESPESSCEMTEGAVPAESDPEEVIELEGDVEYVPEE